MSEYTKPCTTCKAEIRMSNNSGKWQPFDLDGSPHRCYNNDNGQVKHEDSISIPLSEAKKITETLNRYAKFLEEKMK